MISLILEGTSGRREERVGRVTRMSFARAITAAIPVGKSVLDVEGF